MCQYEALAIYSYLFVYQDRITGDIGTVPGFSNPQHPPVGAGCHSEGRIWGLIPDSHSRKFWWSSTNQISTILWTWSKYVDMFYEIVWDSEWNRLIDLFWCFAFWTRFRQCFRQCFLHFVFFSWRWSLLCDFLWLRPVWTGEAMGLDPTDPLLQLLRRSGAEVAGFGQLDETMQRPREAKRSRDAQIAVQREQNGNNIRNKWKQYITNHS